MLVFSHGAIHIIIPRPRQALRVHAPFCEWELPFRQTLQKYPEGFTLIQSLASLFEPVNFFKSHLGVLVLWSASSSLIVSHFSYLLSKLRQRTKKKTSWLLQRKRKKSWYSCAPAAAGLLWRSLPCEMFHHLGVSVPPSVALLVGYAHPHYEICLFLSVLLQVSFSRKSWKRPGPPLKSLG